ncbi:MAG: hypothetical protein ACKOA9_02240 [Actinomycetota bacterium]
MTRFARGLLVAVTATAAVIVALVPAPARAGTNQAVVIVDTGATTYTRVISFSGTVSGLEALTLAGAQPVTSVFAGEGYAVCQLFGVGNDPAACLGTPSDPRYWGYYRAPAGSTGWRYSSTGAAATVVSDGDIEGWRFGGGAPAFRSFCDVVGCAPPPMAAPAPPADPGAVTGAGSAAPAASPADPAPPPETAPADPGASVPSTRPGPPRSARPVGARPVVGDDDTGSPAGVLGALGLVGAIAVVSVVLRRRAPG